MSGADEQVPVVISAEVGGRSFELGTLLSTTKGWRDEIASLLRDLATEIEKKDAAWPGLDAAPAVDEKSLAAEMEGTRVAYALVRYTNVDTRELISALPQVWDVMVAEGLGYEDQGVRRVTDLGMRVRLELISRSR